MEKTMIVRGRRILSALARLAALALAIGASWKV
jgi:hypothetical protein